jgi:hypothetical protein
MLLTCPVLIIAIAAKPASVRLAGSQAAQAEPRPNQPFDSPVVQLDEVVIGHDFRRRHRLAGRDSSSAILGLPGQGRREHVEGQAEVSDEL